MTVLLTSTDPLVAPRRLTSEVTAAFRDALHRRLDSAALADALAERTVVVDLSAVELCDGNGLGVLVGARTRARAQGVSLIMAAPSAALVRAARLTRLYRVLLGGSSSG
jgi:anti-anti-sigma factor